MTIHQFRNRREAGELLARHISRDDLSATPVVLALPRGGAVVAAPIAKKLQVRMHLLVVRKIGAPFQPELAIGAIASGGAEYLNRYLIERLDVSQAEIDDIIQRERHELQRREHAYESRITDIDMANKSVVVVDDGIATGATMEAALMAIRSYKPKEIFIAVPVATMGTVEHFNREVDRVITLQSPSHLDAIGEFYGDFPPVSDDEVVTLLKGVE